MPERALPTAHLHHGHLGHRPLLAQVVHVPEDGRGAGRVEHPVRALGHLDGVGEVEVDLPAGELDCGGAEGGRWRGWGGPGLGGRRETVGRKRRGVAFSAPQARSFRECPVRSRVRPERGIDETTGRRYRRTLRA